MSAAEKLAPAKMTFEEYVEFSLTSEDRYEFHDGDVFLMAGAMRDHNTVVGNVDRELGNAWKSGNGCQPYGSDQLVRIPEEGKGVYPDVSVVCGPQDFEKSKAGKDAVLLNPTLIVEVLSDSTSTYDLSEKFRAYRTIESLREYVVIDPEKPSVQTFQYREGMWAIGPTYLSLEESVRFESVGVEVPMTEVYRGVDLEPLAATAGEEDAPAGE